jgi:hypothetical protein
MTTNLSLQETQSAFQAYVLGAHHEKEIKHAITELIADQFGLSAERRLAIYYDAYRIRLCEALSEAFDKTHAYVGEEVFAELSIGYIEKHPSHFRNLRWFGDAFPAFVAQALPDHPVVAELAGFEWALGVAFDAADAPALPAEEVERLGADDWEHIGFLLQPSQQLLSMHWNVPAIWLALGADSQEEVPPDAVFSEAACTWLIWRRNLQAHFRSLDSCEASALRGLAQGLSFSRVCADAAYLSDEDVTPQIAGWLHGWLSESILTGVTHHLLAP